MKKYRLIFIWLLIFLSCREDKPVPDHHIMWGHWKWLFTKEYNKCTGGVNTIDSTNLGKTIRLEFSSANHIMIYENNVFLREEPIKFKTFEYPNGQGIVPSNNKIKTTFTLMNTGVTIIAIGTLKEMNIYNFYNERIPCYHFEEVYRKY